MILFSKNSKVFRLYYFRDFFRNVYDNFRVLCFCVFCEHSPHYFKFAFHYSIHYLKFAFHYTTPLARGKFGRIFLVERANRVFGPSYITKLKCHNSTYGSPFNRFYLWSPGAAGHPGASDIERVRFELNSGLGQWGSGN